MIKNFLVTAGGILFGVGIIFVVLAVALSFLAFQKLENLSGTLIRVGPLLALTGFSVALFFGFWVTLPATDLRARFLGLLFNYITGVLLLGGLLTGVIGYYWLEHTQIGRFGFACYLVGGGLMLIKISIFKGVIDHKIEG